MGLWGLLIERGEDSVLLFMPHLCCTVGYHFSGKLLLALASTVIIVFDPSGTHDHILLHGALLFRHVTIDGSACTSAANSPLNKSTYVKTRHDTTRPDTVYAAHNRPAVRFWSSSAVYARPVARTGGTPNTQHPAPSTLIVTWCWRSCLTTIVSTLRRT
jgi:hypothetical protein